MQSDSNKRAVRFQYFSNLSIQGRAALKKSRAAFEFGQPLRPDPSRPPYVLSAIRAAISAAMLPPAVIVSSHDQKVGVTAKAPPRDRD